MIKAFKLRKLISAPHLFNLKVKPNLENHNYIPTYEREKPFQYEIFAKGNGLY